MAPRNAVVAEINDKLNSQIPGQAKVYKSLDRTCEPEDEVIYTREFLNSRNDISGVPPHKLSLKVGTPIGTQARRLQVLKFLYFSISDYNKYIEDIK